MELASKKPDIVEYTLKVSKEDEGQHPVLRGLRSYPYMLRFCLDHDNRAISIAGDIRRTYQYAWGPSENQTLEEVLVSAGEQYLMDKIASTRFDLNATLDAMENAIASGSISSYQVQDAEKFRSIRHGLSCNDELTFLYETQKLGFRMDDIPIQKSHSHEVVCVIRMFRHFVLPHVRKQDSPMPGMHT